tara:strand:+ start:247 stop:2037 length:1791 start_codon:yes stop_codon:yes gene_type:complete
MDDMKSAIKGIASKGRNGDNMLVHMAPDEVAGIASLGGVSINPETGLPEMFKFRDFLKIAVPVGIAMATGNPAVAAKMPSFLTNPIGRAVLSGATSALAAKVGGGDSDEVKRAFGTGILADAVVQGGQKMFSDPQQLKQIENTRESYNQYQQQLEAQKNIPKVAAATDPIYKKDSLASIDFDIRTPTDVPMRSATGISSPTIKKPFTDDAYNQMRAFDTRNMMMRGIAPSIALLDSGALDPEEEERRKRKEIDMVAPYTVQARYPGAGYGSREFSYFNPNSMYAKEGGYIKNMQEGGMVDDAPMLAPPPSPSELGLGEPAPMDNTTGIASTIPAEVETTTREDIVPSSAFQGDIMQYAPGILGASNYAMNPMGGGINSVEYDYRNFLPQGSNMSTPSPTGITSTPMGSGEQVQGSTNILEDLTPKRGVAGSPGSFTPFLDYTPMSKIGGRDYTPGESNRMFRDRLIGYNSDGTPRYERQLKYNVAGYTPYGGGKPTGTRIIPIKGMNEGGTVGIVSGMGDGMSDSIYGNMMDDPSQRVALSDGEFVIPADVVSGIGNGSTDAGARQLYAMMDEVRNARTGQRKQAPEINAEEFLPA